MDLDILSIFLLAPPFEIGADGDSGSGWPSGMLLMGVGS